MRGTLLESDHSMLTASWEASETPGKLVTVSWIVLSSEMEPVSGVILEISGSGASRYSNVDGKSRRRLDLDTYTTGRSVEASLEGGMVAEIIPSDPSYCNKSADAFTLNWTTISATERPVGNPHTRTEMAVCPYVYSARGVLERESECDVLVRATHGVAARCQSHSMFAGSLT
eukprot:2316241-Rhodomonas_salina.2